MMEFISYCTSINIDQLTSLVDEFMEEKNWDFQMDSEHKRKTVFKIPESKRFVFKPKVIQVVLTDD